MNGKEINIELENNTIVKAYRSLLKSIRREVTKGDKKLIREAY